MQSEDITFFAGVPTMWWGLLGALTDDVDVDRIGRNLRIGVSGGASLPVEIIKQVKERFHVQILEGYGLSETSPVATFSDPDRDAASGLDRRPHLGDPGQADRRRLERDHRGRRGRRDRDQGPQHHEGLLQPAGGDGRGDPGRMVPVRRPGPPGRGRLLLHRRPVQGHDHPRRLQRVPAGDRGGPDDPRGGLPRRRDRRTPREPRRGDQGRRDPRRGGRGHRGRADRLGARSRWRPSSTPGSWSSSTTSR